MYFKINLDVACWCLAGNGGMIENKYEYASHFPIPYIYPDYMNVPISYYYYL